MAFRVPTFNLDVNLWRTPAVVSASPTLTFRANLSRGERIFQIPVYASQPWDMVSQMILLCPALTDIRPPTGFLTPQDLVEVPAGSGRYYQVIDVDDTAKGFANEYRHAVLWAQNGGLLASYPGPWGSPPWPMPMP